MLLNEVVLNDFDGLLLGGSFIELIAELFGKIYFLFVVNLLCYTFETGRGFFL